MKQLPIVYIACMIATVSLHGAEESTPWYTIKESYAIPMSGRKDTYALRLDNEVSKPPDYVLIHVTQPGAAPAGRTDPLSSNFEYIDKAGNKLSRGLHSWSSDRTTWSEPKATPGAVSSTPGHSEHPFSVGELRNMLITSFQPLQKLPPPASRVITSTTPPITSLEFVTWNMLNEELYQKVIKMLAARAKKPPGQTNFTPMSFDRRQVLLQKTIQDLVTAKTDIFALQEFDARCMPEGFNKMFGLINSPNNRLLSIAYRQEKFIPHESYYQDFRASKGFLATIFRTNDPTAKTLGIITLHLPGGAGNDINDEQKNCLYLIRTFISSRPLIPYWIIAGDTNIDTYNFLLNKSALTDQFSVVGISLVPTGPTALSSRGSIATYDIIGISRTLNIIQGPPEPNPATLLGQLITHGNAGITSDASRSFPSDHIPISITCGFTPITPSSTSSSTTELKTQASTVTTTTTPITTTTTPAITTPPPEIERKTIESKEETADEEKEANSFSMSLEEYRQAKRQAIERDRRRTGQGEGKRTAQETLQEWGASDFSELQAHVQAQREFEARKQTATTPVATATVSTTTAIPTPTTVPTSDIELEKRLEMERAEREQAERERKVQEEKEKAVQAEREAKITEAVRKREAEERKAKEEEELKRAHKETLERLSRQQQQTPTTPTSPSTVPPSTSSTTPIALATPLPPPTAPWPESPTTSRVLSREDPDVQRALEESARARQANPPIESKIEAQKTIPATIPIAIATPVTTPPPTAAPIPANQPTAVLAPVIEPGVEGMPNPSVTPLAESKEGAAKLEESAKLRTITTTLKGIYQRYKELPNLITLTSLHSNRDLAKKKVKAFLEVLGKIVYMDLSRPREEGRPSITLADILQEIKDAYNNTIKGSFLNDLGTNAQNKWWDLIRELEKELFRPEKKTLIF